MNEILNSFSNNFQLIINISILCFLALVTLLEVLDYKGINILWFSKNKRKKEQEFVSLIQKNTLETISKIYECEYQFLMRHEEERINSFLIQLGLKKDQFTKVKLEILRLKRLPMNNKESTLKKLTELCTTENLVLIDQAKLTKVKYPKVNYYINLVDIMFDEEIGLSDELAIMLENLIKENLDADLLNQIDKVVVTTDGNYLLGYKVAKRLMKPFVKMQKTSRIITDHYWDGNLNPNDKIIIVHDVLVTADQIFDSIHKLPYTTEVIGVFCLVSRSECTGVKVLNDNRVKSHWILSINDDEIKKILQEKSNLI